MRPTIPPPARPSSFPHCVSIRFIPHPPPPGAAGEYMKQLPLPGGLPAEQFDYFHEMIAHEEYARTGCPGFCDGMGGGVGAAGGASCL